jgi:hypothetical protein
MTALQWIVKEAKAQKKKYPTKFKTWKEYIKQASKQYNTGIKPSFPIKKVGTVKKKAAKKVVSKKAVKKVGYSKTRLKQEKGITKVLRSTPRTMFPYTAEEKIIKAGKKYYDAKAKGLSGTKRKKKVAKKKKPSEQSILNKIHTVKHDVERLDEAQHKHMIRGIGAVNKHALKQYEDILNKISNIEKHLRANVNMSKDKGYNLDNRKQFKLNASAYKRYLNELKTHAKELKKHL